MTKFITIIFLLFTISCSNINEKVRVLDLESSSCEKLASEIEYANRYKQTLRKNDKFMMRYMLVIPALLETYNIQKNTYDVNIRLGELDFAYKNNNCRYVKTSSQNNSNNYYQVRQNSTFNKIAQNRPNFSNISNNKSKFVPYSQKTNMNNLMKQKNKLNKSRTNSKNIFEKLPNFFN